MGEMRLGADIGGTFTDLVLSGQDGKVSVLKVPTTPASPAEALLAGLERLLQINDVPWHLVRSFAHGSTLGVNTLIQRSGSRVGLLVTKGFGDILEIGRARLPVVNNFYASKPDPLVSRDDVREVDERVTAFGEVVRPLDEEELTEKTRALVQKGVEALVVCFLHSYKYPEHERRARALIAAEFPDLFVCASTEVWPQEREFERASTAVINAYIGEALSQYYRGVEESVRGRGMRGPLFVTKSNGGIMTLASARARPIEALFSGPAAGVVAAAHIGKAAGHSRLIALDIGGTSADVSLIDGELSYAYESQAGDFPVLTPAIHVLSIGAGGGSIAWIDRGDLLKVGPRSAGSEPGPACYGRGGTEPTLTDAYIALGLIRAEGFLGGTMQVNPDLAMAALERLGASLGLTAREAAVHIVQIATAKMLAKFMPHVARFGVDPREFTLIAYGGAGPTHACMLAQEIGIRRVIVPPTPGAMCAIGCILTDLRADFVRTVRRRCADLDGDSLNVLLADLEAEAREWVRREAGYSGGIGFSWIVDMRYSGQSFEIMVPIPEPGTSRLNSLRLESAFHNRYRSIYGIADETVPAEIVNLRLQVVCQTPKEDFEPIAARKSVRTSEARGIWVDGISDRAVVFHRESLDPNSALPGPAVIEQYDTTTFVPRGFLARLDYHGNLLMESAQ